MLLPSARDVDLEVEESSVRAPEDKVNELAELKVLVVAMTRVEHLEERGVLSWGHHITKLLTSWAHSFSFSLSLLTIFGQMSFVFVLLHMAVQAKWPHGKCA